MNGANEPLLLFVAGKLSRALIRAHSALTVQEGLFAAHAEHLEWLDSLDDLPPALHAALASLRADLAARLRAVQDEGCALGTAEAQRYLDRLEDALAITILELEAIDPSRRD